MATYELNVQPREIFGKKVRNLRKQGLVPAEVYGRKIENRSIMVDAKQLRKVLGDAGRTNVIKLNLEGQSPISTFARHIQFATLRSEILHLDFYAVVMDETVTVQSPVHFVGESELLKQGGTLVAGLNTLEVEALPDRIPDSIEVDISILEEYGQSILVNDLKLGDDITIHSSLDSLLVTIQPPRLATELEEEEEGDSIIDMEATEDLEEEE